jgi:hypothetical protein
MDKAFKTWKHAGVQFLAFHNGLTNVMVIDELGRNYGSWMTVERFRELQAKGDELARPMPVRDVQLYVRVDEADNA